MPYDTTLEERIWKVISKRPGTDRKKMFGGMCHLQNGNMVCGVHRDFLILRLGEDQAAKAFEKPHVRPFDITGKPMKGWVMVAPDGIISMKELERWLEKAFAFTAALPPKK